MAKDIKKTKTDSAPTKESPAKSGVTETTAPIKVGNESESAIMSGYSRGEGQKPVSQAYKDNWNSIFKKNKKKKP